VTIPLEWKYPKALLDERGRAASSNDLRTRVRFDLEGRPSYAWGLLTAADTAKFFGFKKFTAIEFGVAEGGGLLEMCRLAKLVTECTGVEIAIAGFDNTTGLPAPKDYRDHPEIWSQGDFAMGDHRRLAAALPVNAQLIIGDIANTLGKFFNQVRFDAPIGFCVFDTDIYSSSTDALRVYSGASTLYLPVGVAYCDDTLGGAHSFGSLMRNRKAGQLLAVDEFNAHFSDRIIDTIRTLKYRRPLNGEQWLDQVYGVHILDHELRNKPRRVDPLTMDEHGRAPWVQWPL
jgi:hypothetical protein